MKIGFFDSGLGGLTVLREVINEGKICEEIYYLADNKNTPYGIKEKEYVKNLVNDNIEYLINIGCNPIVIACNTATSVAINELRIRFPDVEIIGTEPAVKVAIDQNLNKKVFVLATTITVNEEKLHHLITELSADNLVELIPADKLVKFAEDIDCNDLTEEIEKYIYDIFSKYDLKEYSHIVLGCTHFPLFRENIKKVLKSIDENSSIEVIDGAKGITTNLIKKVDLVKKDNESCDKKIHVIMTKESQNFETRVNEIMGKEEVHFDYKLQ